jgi:hypothetical protein
VLEDKMSSDDQADVGMGLDDESIDLELEDREDSDIFDDEDVGGSEQLVSDEDVMSVS